MQEGIDHFMAYGADEVLDVIEPFVEEIAAAPAPMEDPPLVLAAVVALAGPATEVERVVAALVDRGGRRRTAGPRTVLLFDGPATAVRAVRQVELGTPGLGKVGLGLAIAEVAREGAVEGPGVDAARWLADGAGAGELAASEPARILLAGSTAGGLSAATSSVGP